MEDSMYKKHKHLDLESLEIVFKYLKKYFGRVRSVNGILPDPKTGDVKIEIKTVEPLDLNDVYPVGSVYFTTSNVNPGTIFSGTTWEQLPSGKYIYTNDGTGRAGITGGDTTTKYTIPLPQHTHKVSSVSSSGEHVHDKGTMEITGYFGTSQYVKADGAFYARNDLGETEKGGNWSSAGLGFEASRSWTGNTGKSGDHIHTVSIDQTGVKDNTITVKPGYLVLNAWVRIK